MIRIFVGKSNYSLYILFQHILHLKERTQEELEKIKKTFKFAAEDPPFIEKEKFENIDFVNNFYQASLNLIFGEFYGENNLVESIIYKLKGQSFIIPPKSKFFNKDIRNLCQYLDPKENKFDFIEIDPCWKNRYIKRLKRNNQKKSYPVLENEEIENIPVENYIQKSSIVIIWCTNSETHVNAIKTSMIPKWNLKYLQTWYWVKLDKTGQILTPFNNPHQKQPFETIFICAHKDNLDLCNKIEKEKIVFSVPSSIHSHKPNLFSIFQQYLPKNPKCLELFARGLRENFTSVGIEVLYLQNLMLYQEIQENVHPY